MAVALELRTPPAETCRKMKEVEQAGVPSSVNSSWNNLSTNTYNSWVVNGTTGAKSSFPSLCGPGHSPDRGH